MKFRLADKIYHILSFAAVLCLLIPLEMFAFFFLFEAAVHWSALLSAGFFFLGYGMQTLYAALAGAGRQRDHYAAGVDVGRRFTLAAAAGPVAVSLILSVASVFLFRWLFDLRRQTEIIAYFNYDSPFPYLGAAGMFIGLLLGIILWFYPPERLATYRTVIPSAVVLTLVAVFSVGSGNNIFTLVTSVCFCLFILCALLLLNQAHISRSYRGSVVCVLTTEAKLYNTKLMLLMVLLVGVAAALCFVVISGAMSLVKMVMFVLLSSILREENSEETKHFSDPDLVSGEFRQVVYNDSPLMEGAFYLFIAIGLLALLFLIFRRKDFLREILAKIRAFIEEIIAFWTTAKDVWSSEGTGTLNYTDEKRKIQKAAIRDYAAMAEQTDTYERFLGRLNALESADARMGYAYMMLIRVCRSRNIAVKTSDTPREAREKIRRAALADVDEITEALELMKYAEVDLGRRGTDAIESVCMIVKKYL